MRFASENRTWRCRIYFCPCWGLQQVPIRGSSMFLSQNMTYLYVHIQTFEISWLVKSFLHLETLFHFPSSAHSTRCLPLAFHLLLPPDHLPWKLDTVPTNAVPEAAMAVFNRACRPTHHWSTQYPSAAHLKTQDQAPPLPRLPATIPAR